MKNPLLLLIWTIAVGVVCFFAGRQFPQHQHHYIQLNTGAHDIGTIFFDDTTGKVCEPDPADAHSLAAIGFPTCGEKESLR